MSYAALLLWGDIVHDNIKVKGEWLFFLGSHLVFKGENRITQAGLNFLAGLLTGAMPIFLYIWRWAPGLIPRL